MLCYKEFNILSNIEFKGSADPSHFIFKSMSERNQSDIEPLWIWMTSISINFDSIEKFWIQFQSRFMSDPSLSDIGFKN